MISALMNERSFLQPLQSLAVGVCWLLGVLLASANEEVRTWTSSDGRELEAALVEIETDAVVLKLTSGREAIVPLDRLSEPDQKLIETLAVDWFSYVTEDLPEETFAPDRIEVTGGPNHYATPNFSFETEAPVSAAFISEAARVYEGTFEALSAIPHGLVFAPPTEKTHFQGWFMGDGQFERIANARMPSIPGQRVVGLYLGDEQRLLVPYSSLGAERLGSQLTLRKRSDTTTLVHEIVHQVMHRYLPVLPTWFSEGIAEYVSALPYQSGRFEFRNAERGLKERLEREYRSGGRSVGDVMPPSHFLMKPDQVVKTQSSMATPSFPERPNLDAAIPAMETGPPARWTGTVSEYRDALLVVYFFMHLDEPEKAGYPVGDFLQETDRAIKDTESIAEEIDRFEARRLAYNEEVKQFNAAIDQYEAEATAYNGRVEEYNDQLRRGIAETERTNVGEPPVEPTGPELLALPDSLRELSEEGGRIDLVALVENRALATLIDDRPLHLIDARMREKFAEIGIEINYRQ